MTELVLNYSSGLLETIWNNIKGVGRSFVFARQMSANRQIAEYLYHSGEYKSYYEALEDLNRKTLEQMKND